MDLTFFIFFRGEFEYHVQTKNVSSSKQFLQLPALCIPNLLQENNSQHRKVLALNHVELRLTDLPGVSVNNFWLEFLSNMILQTKNRW